MVSIVIRGAPACFEGALAQWPESLRRDSGIRQTSCYVLPRNSLHRADARFNRIAEVIVENAFEDATHECAGHAVASKRLAVRSSTSGGLKTQRSPASSPIGEN